MTKSRARKDGGDRDRSYVRVAFRVPRVQPVLAGDPVILFERGKPIE
jgi:hypothetical protein